MSRGSKKNNVTEVENKDERLETEAAHVEEAEEKNVSTGTEEEKTEKTEDRAEAEKPEKTEDRAEAEKPEKTEDRAEIKPSAKTDEQAETEKTENQADAVNLYETEPFIDPSVYRQKRKKRIGRRIAIALVSLLLAVYAGGVFFHMEHFGTDMTINGIDVSGKSKEEVETMLLDDASKYCLDIKFKDMNYKIPLGEAGTTVSLEQSMDSLLKKHSPFLWFVDLFYGYDYKDAYIVHCDKESLKKYMQGCSAMNPANMKDPRDAKVVLEDGEAKIIPDETGTKLDVEKVYDKIINAMEKYEETLDLEKAECYIPAHILADSESILDAKKQADDFMAIDAAYDFDGYIYEIPKDELTKMAYVGSDGTVQISQNNVASYVEKLKDKFSTAGTDREFTTHDNKTILVHGRYYGWVIDGETETEELYELLCKKKSFTKEPACERRGYAMCDQNDIGSTYVEIDLTNQHVYFYQNGRKKWESDCVSGQTPGHKTPGGLYGLDYKKQHATLVGEDYETPVGYWMPFNGGIGLHDANWRRKFGEDIYTYSGSHGCVNLPVDKAAQLYEYVEAGMPIVCYWRDEVAYVNP